MVPALVFVVRCDSEINALFGFPYSFACVLFPHFPEDDIIDGTEKIKRALLEIFYELNKQRGEGCSIFKKMTTAAVREKEQPISVLTNMVDPNEETFL